MYYFFYKCMFVYFSHNFGPIMKIISLLYDRRLYAIKYNFFIENDPELEERRHFCGYFKLNKLFTSNITFKNI